MAKLIKQALSEHNLELLSYFLEVLDLAREPLHNIFAGYVF